MEKQAEYKTILQQNNNRIISIDAIKAIACICVICLHTLRHSNPDVPYHFVLYYFSRISIPLFFMVIGYLQICNTKCTRKYCIHKILKIIILCSFWITIINVFQFIINGKAIDLLDFAKCYLQGGSYKVFWFFGSMIILYLILPSLNKNFDNNRFAIRFTSVLAGFCLILHIVSVIYASKHNLFLQSYIIQTLRLWTWLLYFSFGGCIKKFKLHEKFSSVKLLFIAVIVFSVCAICEQYYLFKILTNVINSEYYYDSLFMILQVGSIFLFMLNIKYSKIVEKIVSFLAFNLIGCYVFHIWVIKVILPYLGFLEFWGEYVAIIIIVSITLAVSTLVNKIPYINKMIKL